MTNAVKFLLSVGILLGGCQFASRTIGAAGGDAFAGGELIDLTHPFDEQTIYWPTGERFSHKPDTIGMQPGGYYYESWSFCAAEHGGTHLDAPIHFAEHRSPADAIPLERMIGPAITVDVSARAAHERDYLVSVD